MEAGRDEDAGESSELMDEGGNDARANEQASERVVEGDNRAIFFFPRANSLGRVRVFVSKSRWENDTILRPKIMTDVFPPLTSVAENETCFS